MLVIFNQIHCVLTLLTFCKIITRKILIKLLSNQDQCIHFEKTEKYQGLTGLKFHNRWYL